MSERRRRAPRAERTTDVTRVRGVAAAAFAAALAVALAALIAPGGARPLPHAHRAAGLACAGCHAAATMTAACTGCHGPHPSTRAAHRALAAAGTLACADCHPGHAGGGVALDPDGAALRTGTGADADAGATAFRPTAAFEVPIVSAAACARCHDPSSPADPIAACLIAGQAELGLARPTVCFDEHRALRGAAGVIAPRSAAWEAARTIAATQPRAPAPPAPRRPWWWLGLGLVAAAVTGAAVRQLDRRRARRAVRAPVTAPAITLRRLPVIDAATCIGCHACVDACPYDVLEIHRYVAFVARPADCCGLTLCEQQCPNGSLVMALPDAAPAPAALDDSLESRLVPGLYLAGDVTGLALIRNAINHGAIAARAIAARVDPARARARADDDPLDLLIVGAGPAGLSAALEAKALGLRALALEQATVVENIRSFPRGKLVADPDLPTLGRLWIAEASKEELLARWSMTVRQERPPILEGHRVTAIEPTRPGFAIRAVDPDGRATAHRARHVLLAIGSRGSPRRLALDVPAAWASDLHYSLADARSFAQRRVLVVGLGDVAMEAAIALSRQPGTSVVVSYRGADFGRGKARNIAELRRRITSGTLRLVWQSTVAALPAGRAVLATPTGPVDVACDSIFVLIGSIPQHALLRSLGLVPDQIVSEARPFEAVDPVLRPERREEAPP